MRGRHAWVLLAAILTAFAGARFVIADDEQAKIAVTRALELQAQGRLSAALEVYNQLVEQHANRVDLYANRALVLDSLGRTNKAIEDYEQALHLQPNNPDLLLMHGLCLCDAGQWERACKDFDRLIELDGKHAKAWLARGRCHERLGRPDKARSDVRQAIELDPRCHVELIHRSLAKQALASRNQADAFLSELAGDNDPSVQRKRAATRQFIEVMGAGYWDLDGLYKLRAPRP